MIYQSNVLADGRVHVICDTEDLHRVIWPNDPHIEYEPDDEVWGVFFGIAKPDGFLMPGDMLNIGRLINAISGLAAVIDIRYELPISQLMRAYAEFRMLNQTDMSGDSMGSVGHQLNPKHSHTTKHAPNKVKSANG